MDVNQSKGRRRGTRDESRETFVRGIEDDELKRRLEQRAKTDPGTVPSLNEKPGRRGEPGFIFMRPLCDGSDCPHEPGLDEEPPPDDPCWGIPFVWQPDLAAQLDTGETSCPSASALGRIERALGGNLSRFRFSDPEVRVSCETGVISIMVWGTRVPPGSCQDLARQRARIPNLRAGGNFGVFLNSSLIRRLTAEAFQNAPKTYAPNGVPSLSGPIHLTGMSIAIKPPDTIETHISGYDERPWPDVDFTKILIDRLKTLRQCETTERTEHGVVEQIIATLSAIIGSIIIPLLIPFAAFALFQNVAAVIRQPDGSPQGGVGCRVLESLPDEIALPQTGGLSGTLDPGRLARARVPSVLDVQREKLVIAYGQPAVDQRGLFVSALATPQPRVPSIQIAGPASLTILRHGPQTFGEYRVSADDFFGRLSFDWSASGGTAVHIENPDRSRTRIDFRRGDAQDGDTFERTISVRVTDQEGSSATASRTITLFVNEADGTPPICQIRPWLPECNPGGPEAPV